MFFLHHAVCDPSPPLSKSRPDRMSFAFVQMVDKIWYDWQRRRTMNKYAFGGGSVTAFGNLDLFPQFPTGLPPFLNVSA